MSIFFSSTYFSFHSQNANNQHVLLSYSRFKTKKLFGKFAFQHLYYMLAQGILFVEWVLIPHSFSSLELTFWCQQWQIEQWLQMAEEDSHSLTKSWLEMVHGQSRAKHIRPLGPCKAGSGCQGGDIYSQPVTLSSYKKVQKQPFFCDSLSSVIGHVKLSSLVFPWPMSVPFAWCFWDIISCPFHLNSWFYLFPTKITNIRWFVGTHHPIKATSTGSSKTI